MDEFVLTSLRPRFGPTTRTGIAISMRFGVGQIAPMAGMPDSFTIFVRIFRRLEKWGLHKLVEPVFGESHLQSKSDDDVTPKFYDQFHRIGLPVNW